ncbi:malonyl-CoA synthase [Chromatiales bacterium (ex Bugula neritina AB1)]|nr:malonyl-CoA synthase [Chromatiales bacterium (ex Bugula neritina AB1)]
MANALYDTLLAPHTSNNKRLLSQPDGSSMSYAAFIKLAAQYAGALTEAGVSVGDRVAVQVHKTPQALAVYAACIQAGAVFLPLNTAYTAKEVAYFVGDAEPAALLCDPQNLDNLQSAVAGTNCVLHTLDANGEGSLSELARSKPLTFDTVSREAGDLAAILYTSGTTGRSKGAMLTHNNLLSNALTLVDYWKFTADDVLLHALPVYHTHGLFVACNTIFLAGASMIYIPAFNVDIVREHLPDSSVMMGVPTFYTRLLDDNKFDRDTVKHMRLFVSGSAPLLAETHEAFEARTGQRILERYGMTETNMNTSNPYDGERRAGTVGFPLPGVEAKVCNTQTGNELPNGEIGVLEVRGPNVFSGYWRMPDKTAEELKADGFFITGDLATIDADGYIRIVGRNKDLIISGGFNIYPKEIELLLDDQPDVLESAVVGAPHPDFGEGVIALLVAKPDCTIDIDVIRNAMSEALAKFKQPKSYRIVPELPRNTMGKVQKKLLRESVKDSFANNP